MKKLLLLSLLLIGWRNHTSENTTRLLNSFADFNKELRDTIRFNEISCNGHDGNLDLFKNVLMVMDNLITVVRQQDQEINRLKHEFQAFKNELQPGSNNKS